MFRNMKFKIALIASLLLNFSTRAEFDQIPMNSYAFEILMAEHSIGVGIVMEYVARQGQVKDASQFSLLLQHPELIFQRARQHDLSKFSHTPDFVEKFYPLLSTTQLSVPILKYYGRDLRSQQELLSVQEITEAKESFKAINTIDDWLLYELVYNYAKEKNLSASVTKQLMNELDEFEHMSDLLARKLFENIMRFRRNFATKNKIPEIFEFEHKIDLEGGDPSHWGKHLGSKRLANHFSRSRVLRSLLVNIDEQKVVDFYLERTKKSPFIDPREAHVRDKAVDAYIANRREIKRVEFKQAIKNKTSQSLSAVCFQFYTF